MNSRAVFTGFALVVVCACLAQQTEAAGWRERYDISSITRNNPEARTLLLGPLGPVIDIIVEILLFVLDFTLGGSYVPVAKFNKLEREVKSMRAALGGRSVSNSGGL